MKKNLFKIFLIFFIVLSTSSLLVLGSEENYSDIKSINKTNSISSTDSITNINLTQNNFPKSNLDFKPNLIENKTITLQASLAITSIQLNVPTISVFGFNVSAHIGRNLQTIIYSLQDETHNSSFLSSDLSNSSYFNAEVAIVKAPTNLLLNLSVMDSPAIFPLSLSLIAWIRDPYTISSDGNYTASNIFLGETNLLEFTPLSYPREIAFVFSTAFGYLWSLTLYNESGDLIANIYSYTNIYNNNWMANQTTYYLEIDLYNPFTANYPYITNNVHPSVPYTYNILIRDQGDNYPISLSDNTTIIHGDFFYGTDSVNLLFNLKAGQDIRFTENGSRQFWVFSKVNSNQSYWSNYYYVGDQIKILYWNPTTMGQIIYKSGTYQLSIIKEGFDSTQFNIKVTVHNSIIDLSSSKTYNGTIVGQKDFEDWQINLLTNDILTIKSSGYPFSLNIYNPTKKLVVSSSIGQTTEYTALQNGTFIIEVRSNGSMGNYSMTLSIKKQSTNTDFGFDAFTVFGIICVVLIYNHIRKKKREF